MPLDTRLWVPDDVWVNMMLPVPNTILVTVPVVAFITNRGAASVNLSASNPCDINYWEIVDQSGRVVQAEPPEQCTQQFMMLELPAGQTIRGDATLRLNGKLLVAGERYTVRYRFWGEAAENAFQAHHAV